MEKYGKLEYSHFNEFKYKDYNNEVLTLKLVSWDEFHKVVQIFSNKKDYLWRGQRCYGEKWELKSTFDRKFPDINNRQNKLDQIFNNLKQRLEDLPYNKNNSITDDEIWAIGQHYGLPTPFLDWTESPYIATYFAFYKKRGKEQTENRVIYALNSAVKLLLKKTKDSKTKQVLSKKRFVEIPDLGNKLDKVQNERLKVQKGKFTKALDGDDIRLNVERLSNKGKYKGKIILAEILIPDTDNVRNECIAFLKSKKITHGSLFPDYSGAVEICKIDMEID